jgi:hypothetical protein
MPSSPCVALQALQVWASTSARAVLMNNVEISAVANNVEISALSQEKSLLLCIRGSLILMCSDKLPRF